MSTLTKILIILLTISSIFLCGIVVTYVANADNYRKLNESLRTQLDAAVEKRKSAEKQLDERRGKFQQQETQLTNEVAALKTQIKELQAKLNDSERQNAALLQKVDNMASVVETTTQTAKQQTQLFENAQQELKKVRAEQIKQQKQLSETSASLIEKMAIIETLQAEKKQLIEEKAEYQSRLGRLQQPYGKAPAAPVPVTPKKEMARPRPTARAAVEDIGLRGLVTAVDMKNKVASISIGRADGVREGMKFHVIRDDEFICDIVILDVDAEDSVGFIDIMQAQPKVNDVVSTDFNL
ncbi:MAG: hypothetical protein ACYS0I_04785 [Planctomycetota bacterium]